MPRGSKDNNSETPCPHLLTFILSEWGVTPGAASQLCVPRGPSTHTDSNRLSFEEVLIRERLRLLLEGSDDKVEIGKDCKRILLLPDPEVPLPAAAPERCYWKKQMLYV